MMALLLLAGCQELSGQLTVKQAFEVLIKGKTTTVQVGQYKTNLDFKKSKIVVDIETLNNHLKLNIVIPDGMTLPTNGSFELKSAQSQQPFDVVGEVETNVVETETQTRMESCQYQSYQNICNPTGCQTVPVTRTGTHYVEFYYRNTDRKMNFSIVSLSDSKANQADFTGAAKYSEKITTHEGQCF